MTFNPVKYDCLKFIFWKLESLGVVSYDVVLKNYYFWGYKKCAKKLIKVKY